MHIWHSASVSFPQCQCKEKCPTKIISFHILESCWRVNTKHFFASCLKWANIHLCCVCGVVSIGNRIGETVGDRESQREREKERKKERKKVRRRVKRDINSNIGEIGGCIF